MNASGIFRIRNLLLDMDGTIYLGPRAIPGAREFIEYLRASGRSHLFFTNNSSASAGQYAVKLATMGIPAETADILTSGEAMVRFLLRHTEHRRVFVVGTPSFEAEVDAAGLLRTEDKPDAVVLAFDRTLTYAKLELACLLLRAGTPYYATNPDKVCPTEYGYIPDCGSMAALLREATGRMPQFIGKPHSEMVRIGLKKLGASPDSTAMIGDRLYTDMQMAYDAGIMSILVLSGETGEKDLAGADRKPDFMFASVAELRQAFEDADADTGRAKV